jgi:hypothetical protein
MVPVPVFWVTVVYTVPVPLFVYIIFEFNCTGIGSGNFYSVPVSGVGAADKLRHRFWKTPASQHDRAVHGVCKVSYRYRNLL